MSEVIKIENLGKVFHRGSYGGYRALREIFSNHSKQSREAFNALNNISFSVNEGEKVGIIGRNGAGKSTLLKVISRITPPTKGKITLRGKVSSLLEVGTGFHPELTGRENIYLNGVILGMKRSEINAAFDDIVDFSGIGEYLDTPVKRYSSGMYVRLAFAVAAHLQSDILIVDEVLAVGDYEFQKKCLQKLNDVSRQQGKTVLFVSHNLPVIQKLCTHGILLNGGEKVAEGPMTDVINHYLKQAETSSSVEFAPIEDQIAYFISVRLLNENDKPVSEVPIGKRWKLKMVYGVNKKADQLISAIGLRTANEVSIKSSWQLPMDVEPGIYESVFEENLLTLAAGRYSVNIGLSQHGRSIDYKESVIQFEVMPVIYEADESLQVYYNHSGMILNPMKTSTKKLS